MGIRYLQLKTLLQITFVFILSIGAWTPISVLGEQRKSNSDSSKEIFSGKKKPLIWQRADPWIHRTGKGHYYFTGSVPEFDRIILRESATIEGLTDAQEQVIWRKAQSGPKSANIWAPELHRINNIWYIYFAAGEIDDPFAIRMYVLKNSSADPMEGSWTELGKVKTSRDTFSLDATSFIHRNKRYLIWAQQDNARSYNSGLVISELISPLEVGSREVYISEPLLSWERQGYKVNEGAAVIKRNGKIFITYSASATDHRYAIGLIWANENDDLLDSDSWHKLPEPIFTTNESLIRFGPGHNSFTIAEDGETDIMIYHARDYYKLKGTPLTDGNRHTRYRTITWSSDGYPEFHNGLDD
ncbi:MAG: family 43 glycosylhydrolase [Kangiellaceae bacterium]|nr:family 43 glycosylhydrolase [Kangiellaceae bacterium]